MIALWLEKEAITHYIKTQRPATFQLYRATRTLKKTYVEKFAKTWGFLTS